MLNSIHTLAINQILNSPPPGYVVPHFRDYIVFLEFVKCREFHIGSYSKIFSASLFFSNISYENLDNFLTKLFKGGN